MTTAKRTIKNKMRGLPWVCPCGMTVMPEATDHNRTEAHKNGIEQLRARATGDSCNHFPKCRAGSLFNNICNL